MADKNSHIKNLGPISSVSVSTTNTSDSNITTSHSLNLPQNLLESMSQVSSNYSIDKSSSTLATRETTCRVVNNTTKKSIMKTIQSNLEESEESDVLNEIFKVNQWLKDNHQKTKNNVSVAQLIEKNLREDVKNKNSIESILSNTLSEMNNMDEDDFDDDQTNTEITNNKGSSGENNDSAIDISSYG